MSNIPEWTTMSSRLPEPRATIDVLTRDGSCVRGVKVNVAGGVQHYMWVSMTTFIRANQITHWKESE